MSKRKDRDEVDDLIGAMDEIAIEHTHDPDDIVASMGAMSMADRPSKRARGAPSTLNTSASSSGFTHVNPKTKGNSRSTTFERKMVTGHGAVRPNDTKWLHFGLSEIRKDQTRYRHGKGGPLSKIINLPIQKDPDLELTRIMENVGFF